VPALQNEIATLQKSEAQYRDMEQRLGLSNEAYYRALKVSLDRSFDKRFKEARRFILLVIVAFIAVEILAHSLWPGASPKPAQAISGETSPTPTATVQATGTPAKTDSILVADPATKPQKAQPASTPKRQRVSPAHKAKGNQNVSQRRKNR
jgi:hypothetical protein